MNGNMNDTDTRLLRACNSLSKTTRILNESVLYLHTVISDYVSADQEREDKIRELEEEVRSYQDEKHLKHAYRG